MNADTFRDQVVVITGGGTGLGLEAARQFARGGARLVLASRSEEHLAPAAEQLRTAGASVLTVVTDVRRPASVRKMVEQSVEHFGRIDILVNNAAGNFLCHAEDLSPGGWKVVIDIALNGVFYCSREVGRHFIERGGGGQILNVVAAYAWTGGPGTVHSAAAKAGVVAMTRTLAVEWAQHGIRVNAICPGVFHSDGAQQRLWPTEEAAQKLAAQVPLGRFGEAEEMAHALLWLASPEARYVNGEILVIDGGASLGRGILHADPDEAS